MDEDRKGPGPLFETPISRVLASLPETVAEVFRQRIDADPISFEQLRREIPSYLAKVEAIADTEEFVDVATARKVAHQCDNLLNAASRSVSEENRRLVQAAVQYFLLDHDATGDTTSVIGFDDDQLVISAVAEELGLERILTNL